MTDTFASFPITLAAPASSGIAASPDGADVPLSQPSRWIYIGVAGDLAVILADNETSLTIPGLAVGFYKLRVATILYSGTTASSIVALW